MNRPPLHRRADQPPKRDYRPSAAARGYGGRWRRIRRVVLAEEPLCRPCGEQGRIQPAEHVDHDDGNVENMDRANLVPMCHSCHSRKTVRRDGGFGR